MPPVLHWEGPTPHLYPIDVPTPLCHGCNISLSPPPPPPGGLVAGANPNSYDDEVYRIRHMRISSGPGLRRAVVVGLDETAIPTGLRLGHRLPEHETWVNTGWSMNMRPVSRDSRWTLDEVALVLRHLRVEVKCADCLQAMSPQKGYILILLEGSPQDDITLPPPRWVLRVPFTFHIPGTY